MKIKRFTGGELEENGYVIYHRPGGECFVIDPGHSPEKFIKYMKEQRLHLQGILLTHHHYDHTGAIDSILEYREVPVFLHREDLDMAKFEPDVILEGEDMLKLDDEDFQVIHTPGHTLGSVCYYFPDSGVIFTGDTLFYDDIGRTDLKDSDDRRMHKSCRNLDELLENEVMVYPGHDAYGSMKSVRKINSYFNEYAGRR